MGKEPFTRNILIELHNHGLYKRNAYLNSTPESEESRYNVHDQFGIIIIPEHGAPCGDMVSKSQFNFKFS